MEMYIGKIVKSLRKSKKITQKDLAKGVCSIKQLIRIEQNKSAPNSYLLYELSNRLGTDLLDYLPYCNDENAYELKNAIDQLENLYDRHLYKEVKVLLDHSKRLKSPTNLRARKLTEWFRGAISNNIDVDYTVNVDYYMNIYRYDDDIKTVDDIFKSFFTDVDSRIINSITVLYLKNKNYLRAEELLLKSIKKINSEPINAFHSYYTKNLYNLSRLYINLDRYSEAIIYSKKGIEHCVKYNSLSYLADLYNILGRSKYKLGEEETGREYLKNYINIRKLLTNDFEMDEIMNRLTKFYNL